MASGSLAILGCLVVAAIGNVHADAPEALLGAEFAKDGEFPYLVSIRKNNRLHCGGAIIGPYHILTAAHCLRALISQPLSVVTIVTGTNNLYSGGETYSPALYIPHEKYDPNNEWKYDVGVIKLTSPIKFNDKQKQIALPTSKPPVNVFASIGAWGATTNPPKGISSLLKKLDLKMIPLGHCEKYFTSQNPDEGIEDIQICAFNAKNVGTCSGDSGSPLVYNEAVVGIVSGGIPCATGLPDIFTNVYMFLDFIERAMSL